MASSHRVPWIALSAAFSALASGCLLDAGPYEGAGAAPGTTTTSAGGATSAGGTGGTGTGAGGGSGTTDSGGSTSSGGTGGTTTSTTNTMPECSIDANCPDPGGFCVAPSCTAGVCGGKPDHEGQNCGAAAGACFDAAKCVSGSCVSSPKSNGTEVFDTDLGNCTKPVCDGQGNVSQLPNDFDKPFDNECATYECSNGMLLTTPRNEGGVCVAIGKCCDGKCCDATCTVCGP